MKNKRIIYIILMLLTCFIYMDRVSATTAKVCKYSKSGKYDVYLYQTANGNHYAYKMSSDGNNHKIYNASLKSDIDDFSECPKYMQVYNSDTKFGFTDNKHWRFDYSNIDYNDDKTYTSWECSYDNVVVKQNKKGLISYTINGKYVTNNYLLFYDYSFNSGTCPGYFASKAYSTDSSKLVFYKDKEAVEGVNNGKTAGYTAAKDTSTNNDSNLNNSGSSSSSGSSSGSSSSGSSSSGSSSSSSSSNGSGLGIGRYCVYKNLGYCTDSDGDIAGDCGVADRRIDVRQDFYFKRARYAIFKYSTTNNDNNNIESVYLPKYIVPGDAYVIDPDISDKIDSDFNKFDGSFDKLSSMVSSYFVKFSGNEIAVIVDENTEHALSSSETDENGCPKWFSAVNGTDGQDYEDSEYFYQLYGTSVEDNDNTEDAEIVDSGIVVDAGEGPYYCIYDGTYGSINTKSGTLALFYDPDNSKLKLLSYDFGTAYLNSKCALDDCSTADNVKFVGYGGAESNDGSFQSNFIAATTETCPKQINFNYNKGILTICKDESSECINGGGGILGNINRFSNSFDESFSNDSIEITSCDDLISDDLRKILNKYFLAFRIIVPLAVLAFGIIDFAKSVFVTKEEDMKKNQTTFVKRLIIAVAIFFIPTFVNLLLDVANTVWGWNAGTCNIENVSDE